MIPWLSSIDAFPPLHRALGADTDAPGLLAASAELSAQRLEKAYRSGIFPWYSAGQPVLWWSPDPRMVLPPSRFKVSASLRKTLKQVLRDERWQIRIDVDFAATMHACAHAPREGQNGTWITPMIVDAYGALHAKGLAHSVETWYAGECVGGLYGVSIGKMFFGESMFARRTDASKIALAALCAHLRRQEVALIDCQQNTQHLSRLGGFELPRSTFITHLEHAITCAPITWPFDKSVLADWCHLVPPTVIDE
jgi:leucyl/phenylalanyl-tRNA--protein transferase